MRKAGVRPRVLPVALLTLAASGCLTEIERPDSATFRIQSVDEVRVITSTRFVSASGGVELVEADTIFVSGAYQGTVELDPPTRFYINTSSLSEGNVVSMDVFIGDKQWYESTKTLALEEFLQFIYGFSGL